MTDTSACICAGGPRADVKDPECAIHGRRTWRAPGATSGNYLFGALGRVVSAALNLALAPARNGATAPGAAACSVCGGGPRKGVHVAVVFQAATSPGNTGLALVFFPVDREGRRTAPLCLPCAVELFRSCATTVGEIEAR